jgi:hypothetical protein
LRFPIISSARPYATRSTSGISSFCPKMSGVMGSLRVCASEQRRR